MKICRRVIAILPTAALVLAGGAAFAWQPLEHFEDIDNLRLKDDRLTWQVWVPGESEEGDRWDPLFHDSVSYWNGQVPYYTLSAVTRDVDDCSPAGGAGWLSPHNQVSTVSWRDSTCGGYNMDHAAGWASTFLGYPNGSTVIAEGDIFFNDSYRRNFGREGQMVYDEKSFYSVALHEIGHTLGLGHGVFDGAVMAYGPTHKWHQRLSPDDVCGVAVISGNREHCPISLGEAVATSGAETGAHFSGYASADAGASARAALRPWQEFNIYATVLIDADHRHWPGQLHVVAETEQGEFFARDADGDWHPHTGGELPAATPPGALGHVVELIILGRNGISRGEPAFDPKHGYRLYRQALTGFRLGLEGVKLRFWVAYSSEAATGELIYGSEPIRVEWTLD